MYSKKSNPIVFAKTGSKVVINPNLALTPGQMDDRLRQGLPIGSVDSETNYFDGTQDCSYDLPLMSKRGVDIADAWEASMSAHQSISKLNKLASQQNVQPSESK